MKKKKATKKTTRNGPTPSAYQSMSTTSMTLDFLNPGRFDMAARQRRDISTDLQQIGALMQIGGMATRRAYGLMKLLNKKLGEP